MGIYTSAGYMAIRRHQRTDKKNLYPKKEGEIYRDKPRGERNSKTFQAGTTGTSVIVKLVQLHPYTSAYAHGNVRKTNKSINKAWVGKYTLEI